MGRLSDLARSNASLPHGYLKRNRVRRLRERQQTIRRDYSCVGECKETLCLPVDPLRKIGRDYCNMKTGQRKWVNNSQMNANSPQNSRWEKKTDKIRAPMHTQNGACLPALPWYWAAAGRTTLSCSSHCHTVVNNKRADWVFWGVGLGQKYDSSAWNEGKQSNRVWREKSNLKRNWREFFMVYILCILCWEELRGVE